MFTKMLTFSLGFYVSACFSFLTSTSIFRAFSQDFEAKCKSFKPDVSVVNCTHRAVEYIPAGTNLSFPDEDQSCGESSHVVHVDICRVALTIQTSNISSVETEVWLPRNWSGRLLGTGNGGLGGCIKYDDLAYGVRHAFATVGSNNGHNGNTAIPLYQNPERIIDFSWRALHMSVVAGKQLSQKFYGHLYTTSYYIGCSLGGRQGINSAEKFPADFDGIVAGAPAIDFNNLVSWRAHFFPITKSPNSKDFIEPSAWSALIHDEVLKQCDGIDGVNDGIIEDPSLCNFRPEALACMGDSETDCLTPGQIESVREIFSPMMGEAGELIYPAMQPGGEVLAAEGLYAGKPFRHSEEWFKYVIHDPSWDPSTFDLKDAYMADALNPANIKTWPSDLSKFESENKKLIVYHGSQDDKITSFNTERFYRHLNRQAERSATELDKFLRFFRISGMGHCHQGPGAWAFGQSGTSQSDMVPFTRDTNVLAAIVDWVEQGIAPETIEGVKLSDNTDSGIPFRRRHCRYPFRNKYLGGDDKSPDSWQCQKMDTGIHSD